MRVGPQGAWVVKFADGVRPGVAPLNQTWTESLRQITHRTPQLRRNNAIRGHGGLALIGKAVDLKWGRTTRLSLLR